MLADLFPPVERIGAPPGAYINAALLGIMALGFILSLWRPRVPAGA